MLNLGLKNLGISKILAWSVLIVALLGLAEGFGFFTTALPAFFTWLFVAVGSGIALMNIKESEATSFMVATLVVGIGAGTLALLPTVGGALEAMLERVAQLVVPAAVVTGIKTIYNKSK